MEIPVNRSNLTTVVPSPEWQNLVFESDIVDPEPRRLLCGWIGSPAKLVKLHRKGVHI
jgi:hypothetical protein